MQLVIIKEMYNNDQRPNRFEVRQLLRKTLVVQHQWSTCKLRGTTQITIVIEGYTNSGKLRLRMTHVGYKAITKLQQRVLKLH